MSELVGRAVMFWSITGVIKSWEGKVQSPQHFKRFAKLTLRLAILRNLPSAMRR
jgi:hypothetical protein